MRNSAFTLLEIIAVVAIIALAAGLAGWSLHRTHRSGTTEQVIDRLIAADQRARTYARRFRQPIDLGYSMHAVSARLVENENSGSAPWSAWTLHDGFTIDRVQVVAPEPDDAPHIRIAANGRSLSYVVVLSGPKRSRHWLFFSGLTGETHVVDNPQAIEQLLALGTARRLDMSTFKPLSEWPDVD